MERVGGRAPLGCLRSLAKICITMVRPPTNETTSVVYYGASVLWSSRKQVVCLSWTKMC